MWQNFLPFFNGWIISHYMYILHFAYPFICLWILGSLSHFSYCKQYCCEHWCINTSSRLCLQFSGIYNKIWDWTGLKIHWAWPCPSEQGSDSPQLVLPIRRLPQASYPYPSEGRQNGNHSYRKLTRPITWTTALSNSMKLWALKKCGPLEKGMASQFSVPSSRTPRTVRKGEETWHWKVNSPGGRCPIFYWRSVEK